MKYLDLVISLKKNKKKQRSDCLAPASEMVVEKSLKEWYYIKKGK